MLCFCILGLTWDWKVKLITLQLLWRTFFKLVVAVVVVDHNSFVPHNSSKFNLGCDNIYYLGTVLTMLGIYLVRNMGSIISLGEDGGEIGRGNGRIGSSNSFYASIYI